MQWLKSQKASATPTTTSIITVTGITTGATNTTTVSVTSALPEDVVAQWLICCSTSQKIKKSKICLVLCILPHKNSLPNDTVPVCVCVCYFLYVIPHVLFDFTFTLLNSVLCKLQ